jgi:wyosine [tRNA(Phe)-imidazoG37] synthetase (radical SAM superfamily)
MQDTQPALTFGPVISRRFGMSLGIDLSPNSKQCNFDCLYCELKGAKTVSAQSESLKPELYVQKVQEAIIKFPKIDVITITANGEPTLYPYLDKLVDMLNDIKEDKKLLILSNSGLMKDENIIKILHKIDIVKLSLDCATKECFKKLDRIDKSINHQDIIDGIIEFSKTFKSDLILEVLFVDTINNKPSEIEKLSDLIQQIQPKRIDIGTIDRPPAYDVKPISYEELLDISKEFEGQNISIAHRQKIKSNKFLNEDEILNLLDKRPQTKEDIENLLDTNSQELFDKLFDEKKIHIVNVAGLDFYKC